MVLEKQQTGAITAEMIEGEAQRAARVSIGDYTATLVSTSHVPACAGQRDVFAGEAG